MKLDFISVKVEDMERAVEFYNQLLMTQPEYRSDGLAMFNYESLSFSLYNPETDGISHKNTEYGNNCIPALE